MKCLYYDFQGSYFVMCLSITSLILITCIFTIIFALRLLYRSFRNAYYSQNNRIINMTINITFIIALSFLFILFEIYPIKYFVSIGANLTTL